MSENHSQKATGYMYIPVAILCNLLWGSAIPMINVGYRLFDISSGQTGSQILFAGIRFFLAGLITILVRSISLKKTALPKKGNWHAVLILASTQTIGQYVLFYIGVANTMSVKASIIQGLNAFVSILIASYLFRYEKMTLAKWIAGFMGILGIVVINWRAGSFGGSVSFMGEGFLILSMTSAALSSGLIKKFAQTDDPVTLSGWQFTVGGAVMALAGLVMGGKLNPQGTGAYMTLLYLGALSAIAYSLWAMLLKSVPISKIAVFMFLQPLFGVILGIILVHQKMEIPAIQYIAALALVCGSIVIINYRPKEPSA